MTITALRTLCLSRLHERERQWVTSSYRTIKADCAIVVIDTDEGLVGIAEASAYGGPLQIREWVSWLGRDLIGRDPRLAGIAPHPNGRDRAYDCAVAGIDGALWDLRGKIEGRRVCQLATVAGGNALEQVRLYASSGCRYDWRALPEQRARPEQLIEETLRYVADGYTAVKFRLGTEWAWDGVTVERFLGLVRELHSAVAGRADLMLDGNCRLNEGQALAVALELDRLGFAWFEEPIPAAQIDAYARLCAAVDMPISGGEGFTTVEQFRPYLERRAYDIVQPDVGLCGLTEALAIARFAERYGVRVAPHSWHNGLMAMANGHFVAALPQPLMLELCMIQGPLQWDILRTPPTIEAGRLHLPDAPGLGVELAEDLEARFPFIEGGYALTVQR
jgi:L-alanine-DL-glutamate epimerase-like enolase superfamily enzyme